MAAHTHTAANYTDSEEIMTCCVLYDSMPWNYGIIAFIAGLACFESPLLSISARCFDIFRLSLNSQLRKNYNICDPDLGKSFQTQECCASVGIWKFRNWLHPHSPSGLRLGTRSSTKRNSWSEARVQLVATSVARKKCCHTWQKNTSRAFYAEEWPSSQRMGFIKSGSSGMNDR